MIIKEKELITINKNKTKETNTEIKRVFKSKEKEKGISSLDGYELNHLKYEEALEKDKRGFCKIYWSIIKRDELFIFTFISWNDYNLINNYINKIFTIYNKFP